MFKRVFSFVLVQLLFVGSSFAVAYKSNDKFQFMDREGEQIAYLECSNLKYQDTIAINRIVASSKNDDVVIEGLIVKKQKIGVMYSGKSGRAMYEFDSYTGDCEVTLN